jgi:hypothetical protein
MTFALEPGFGEEMPSDPKIGELTQKCRSGVKDEWEESVYHCRQGI